ncbi:MAG: hypothetical protein IPL40_05355 [Proteobacteria bacterium]|nr:hypothetical protein [Pseudomonadota bacterium]
MKTLLAVALASVALISGDRPASAFSFDLPALLTSTRDRDTLPLPAVLPGRAGTAAERATGQRSLPPTGATAVEQPRPSEPTPPSRAARGSQPGGKRGAVAPKGGDAPGPKRRAAEGPALPPAPATEGLAPSATPPELLTAPPTRGAGALTLGGPQRARFVPEPLTPLVPSTILRLHPEVR